ncbi:MAG TPA: tetratricopeptide repeat protein [Allosphingosinicella sp.]
MKSISTFALAAALLVGSAVVTAPYHPAEAKKKKGEEAAAATSTGRTLVITPAARPAMSALDKAVKAKDKAAFDAALPVAEAAATTPDEKYFVATSRYQFALDANDEPGQVAALEAIIASGAAQANQLAVAHFDLGVRAFAASDFAKAETAFTQALAANPAETGAMFNLAVTQIKLNKKAEALAMLQRAIDANKAASKPVPEGWYKTALTVAFETRSPTAQTLSNEVLAAYPTRENWRNALVVFRDSVKRDTPASIDILRLMRASKSMTTKAEYYDLALALSETNPALPYEAQKVIDEAVAANLARTSDDSYRRVNSFAAPKLAEDQASLPGLETRARAAATGKLAFNTADALLGYGQYAKAADLYRTAISKGGDVDVPLANQRLGIALALAGDKAGAEAAFKAVTGARAPVAALWLSWLTNPIQG